MLVPVVLAPDTAVAHDERGGITRIATPHQVHGVAIEGGDGDGMLNRGVPVEYLCHVQLVHRHALRDHQDVLLARIRCTAGYINIVQLAVAVAVLAFVGNTVGVGVVTRAVLNVQRVVDAVDHRFVGVLGAIEDEAGGVDPRPQH